MHVLLLKVNKKLLHIWVTEHFLLPSRISWNRFDVCCIAQLVMCAATDDDVNNFGPQQPFVMIVETRMTMIQTKFPSNSHPTCVPAALYSRRVRRVQTTAAAADALSSFSCTWCSRRPVGAPWVLLPAAEFCCKSATCLPACWSCVAAVKICKLLNLTRSFVTKIAASDQQNLWKKKVVLTPWTVFLIWLFRSWVFLWN